jgi:hypothetical protein
LLSRRAQEIRTKIEELDELIAKAAPDTLFGEESQGDGGAAPLREAREAWQARLTETVSMLESIRVGLLRLHAGSASPDSLTADLEGARVLHERLGLLNEGHAEVDSLLPNRSRPVDA